MGIGGIVFGWINERLIEAQSALIAFLEVFLRLRPPGPNTAEQVLYSITWGYADLLAALVAVAVLLIAMFNRGYFRNFIDAIVTLLLISFAGGVLLGILWSFRGIEAQLMNWADWYDEPPRSSSFFEVAISNPFVSVLGLGLIALLCFMIAAGFTAADMFSFGAKLLFLPSLALVPLADFFRKLFGVLLASIVVADLFGRPAAIFWLNTGEYLKNTWDFGRSALGSYMVTAVTTALMAASIWIIAKAAYNVPGRIKGWMSGAIRVSNDVMARLKPGQKVDTRVTQAQFGRSFTDQPVPVVVKRPQQTYASKMTHLAVDRVSTATKAAAAAYGGVAGGVVGSAAVDSVSGKIKRKTDRTKG